jgi:hypothetical protein
MKTFFADFSPKNWLFLVLTLIGIALAVEAILNFRLKWKNWRASKSKKGLEKRLDQLYGFISQIAGYQKNPTDFFIV